MLLYMGGFFLFSFFRFWDGGGGGRWVLVLVFRERSLAQSINEWMVNADEGVKLEDQSLKTRWIKKKKKKKRKS